MLNKKGATTGDILSFFLILVCGSVLIMGFAYFVVAPAIGGRAEKSINEYIAKFNDNTFALNYLRAPVGDNTMADLILQAVMNNDFSLVERETDNFMTLLNSMETGVCCRKRMARGVVFFKSYYLWKEERECDDIVENSLCISWKLYIDDEEVIDKKQTAGDEKSSHTAYTPNYYGLEPIKLKIVLY